MCGGSMQQDYSGLLVILYTGSNHSMNAGCHEMNSASLSTAWTEIGWILIKQVHFLYLKPTV